MAERVAEDSSLDIIAQLRGRVADLEAHRDLDALRILARWIPDNIMLLDAEGLIQFINWTVPDLTPEQVVGTKPESYVPETYRSTFTACLEAVRATHQPSSHQCEYVAEDGSVSRWEARIAPVLADDSAGGTSHQGWSRVVGFAIVNSNVTEREEAAADRQRFFDMSLDLCCVATLEGCFRRTNPAFEHTLGWSSDDLRGEPFIDFVHSDDARATEDAIAKLREGAMVADFEVRCRCRDGSFKSLQWRATAVRDLGLVYAVGRDVTQSKALVAQLLQSQKMEAVGNLAGGVAHDFNNLLLAIRGNAELSLRKAETPAVLEALEEIKRSAERAATLTRQLLAFSRRQAMRAESLDLGELTDGLVKMLRRIIPASVELELTRAHELPLIQADRGQIEQVILNLCINARDAMPDGGRITIAIETVLGDDRFREAHPWARAARYVMLRVTDTGVGMTPEIQGRAFEPFFTTKEVGRGTGLGLSTAYGIVEQHGGAIHIDSKPAVGTTFEVYLPVAERSATNAESKIPEPVRGGNETLVVAEDADAVRSVVARVLEEAGYRVLRAKDGLEAVALVEQHGAEVALVLLDVVMPGLSGPEARRAIRALLPDMTFLFTSGYSDGVNAAGIAPEEQVLHKPYEPDELLRIVRRALDR